MAKYHNSPNGPRICTSRKGLCPYAQAGQPHFESQREAQEAYENVMAATFGPTAKLNRTLREKALQATYRRVDRVHDRVKLANLSPAAQAAYRAVAAVNNTARATERGASRLRAAIATPREEVVAPGAPSLGSMYRTADTRQRLLSEGVASRATSRQISKVNRTPRVLSPYGAPRTMRSDALTVGDRLETKEVVVGIRRNEDGTTSFSLQSGDAGAIRQSTLRNGEPIRASRYNRRGEKFQARVNRMRGTVDSMRNRFAVASRQQREVVNTLRGVGYSHRAQVAVRLPEVRGAGNLSTSAASAGGRNGGTGNAPRYALPGTRVMPRVNAQQYHQVAKYKEIRETAQRIRQRSSERQRFNAEEVASRRANA